MIAAAANGADLVGVGGVVNGLTQAIVAGKGYKNFKDLRGATSRCASADFGRHQRVANEFSSKTA